MYYPDYACLVCGEEMPKVDGTMPRRDCYGDYDQYTEFYDTSKDCYFVRFDEPKNLKEQYRINAEKLYQLAKEKMKNDMEQVSNEEFREILENQMPRKVDKDFKTSLEAFDEFVYFFRQEFKTGVPQSRYSINSSCMKTVLKNAKRMGKAKYVIESENEKILRLVAKLDEKKFTQAFPFLSKNFGLDFLDSSSDSLTLEFAHFSEFPLRPDR
jgi:ADP-dependent phosphofructokinase/glucokinase